MPGWSAMLALRPRREGPWRAVLQGTWQLYGASTSPLPAPEGQEWGDIGVWHIPNPRQR